VLILYCLHSWFSHFKKVGGSLYIYHECVRLTIPFTVFVISCSSRRDIYLFSFKEAEKEDVVIMRSQRV